MAINTKMMDADNKTALVTMEKVPEMKFGASIFEVGQELLQKGVTTVIFDLVDAVYVPMDGLGMLNTLHQQAVEHGGKIVLVCHNANLKMLLNSTTLARVMEICDSVDEAVRVESGVSSIDNFIDKLNDDQKFWYLCAVANMIVADGEISPDEVSVAESMFEHIELEADRANRVQEIFQTMELYPLELRTDIDSETGMTILQTLTLIAISDHSLDNEEKEALRQISTSLGNDPSVAEEIIQWGVTQLEAARANA